MIPCIIPVRGGSKGIPRKNLIEVGGKPLVVWSIEQAVASSLVDGGVMVATDDKDISKLVIGTGAGVWHRSAESATDDAPTEMVLLEVVEQHWRDAEAVVFLQATSPIRQPNDIDDAIEHFRKTGADSLFSARRIEGYTWSAGGRVLSPRDGYRKPRQQETRNNLEENGSIYIFKPSILVDHGSRLGGKIVPYLMHPMDSFQVDEPEDIPIIESLMEIRLVSHAAA